MAPRLILWLGDAGLASLLVALPIVSAWLAAWLTRHALKRERPPAAPAEAVPQQPTADPDARTRIAALEEAVSALGADLQRLRHNLNAREGPLEHQEAALPADALAQPHTAPTGPETARSAVHERPGLHKPTPHRVRQPEVSASRLPTELTVESLATLPTPNATPAPVRAMPAAKPAAQSTEPSRELSDEELDALPPELPAPTKPRKRILPPPRKPTLSKL